MGSKKTAKNSKNVRRKNNTNISKNIKRNNTNISKNIRSNKNIKTNKKSSNIKIKKIINNLITLANNKNKNKNNSKNIRKLKLKKLIPVIIIIILIVFAAFKVNSNNEKEIKNDNLIYNQNKSFLKAQKIDGILFKNISCTYDGKDSLISYSMINETNKAIYLNNYDVLVKDKKGVTITKIAANFQNKIKPKEEIKMANSVIGVDLSNAYSMQLKLKIKK